MRVPQHTLVQCGAAGQDHLRGWVYQKGWSLRTSSKRTTKTSRWCLTSLQEINYTRKTTMIDASGGCVPSVYHQYTISIPSVYHQYTISILSAYHQCIISVPSVYRQYTISVPSVYHQCTISVPSVYHQYTISILSVYHQCIISISSVYRHCTVNVSYINLLSAHVIRHTGLHQSYGVEHPVAQPRPASIQGLGRRERCG